MITEEKLFDVAKHDEEGLKKDTVLNANSSIEDINRKCREIFEKNTKKRNSARKRY